jgi:hypothetical protein
MGELVESMRNDPGWLLLFAAEWAGIVLLAIGLWALIFLLCVGGWALVEVTP